MDFLKGQLDKIQQQLGGLNASQKMLTGSLIAIMVMTLLWWGRYAGTAEMEPLLPQPFKPDEIGRVQAQLKSGGIPSRVEGDRVLVPADRRDEALASLAFADVLPQDSASGFDEISKRLSSFMPNATSAEFFKEGKQRTLQNVVRELPGVKHAVVLIEPAPEKRRLRASNEASASILITMRDGGVGTRKVADGAARLVAGAQRDLPAKNVQINIGGHHYRMTNDGDGYAGSDELGRIVADHQRQFETRIQDLYHFIDGLLVKVNVTVNTETTQTQAKKIDPNVPQKELETETRTETEPVTAQAPAEPGALPNTGASIDPLPAATAGGERSREETRTKFENFPSTTMETKSKPAGEFAAVSAAVRVPRSYFLRVFKNSTASTAEPTLAVLQPIIDAEVEKIRNDVVWTTGIEDQTKVAVSMYDDAPSQLLVGASAAPPNTVTQSLTAYGKEIAIGALAVISLFMVSMMVRKGGAPVPILAQAAEPRETPHFDGTPELAGIVGGTSQMLDGMELDEDAVRTQQMLDQVSTLVGENPDAAANLVKRWLNRT